VRTWKWSKSRLEPVLSTSVENRSPIICFAITSGGKRAAYWRLRAGLKQPELFLEREGYGEKFHFSLHASGQWHMKEGRQGRISWARPGEVVPGYTRAVGIVQPVATAVREDPPAEETVLVPVPADANPTTFSLFIECRGANLDNSWPGKNADGTTPVGRIPLAADAGTCCVVLAWTHGVVRARPQTALDTLDVLCKQGVRGSSPLSSTCVQLM
jgi:hypothetical protein